LGLLLLGKLEANVLLVGHGALLSGWGLIDTGNATGGP
jgi:hypothetical protein